ncbi:phosphotransferase enzyme family protein [Pedobacter foliorum]|uniref:phosphotransferase enzyme family protein n=1 Tax=Pedobacter foliorum TaxID=2739058 RepID=UPI001566BA9C|nr:phosphotransferase [Pedobacter foliorum]NRF38532.1 phosphotransferase [Pedobacter foliorum]
MQIFPTQYSVLCASAVGDLINQQYGFAKTSCRILIRNVGDTYVLSNENDKYIFKIYRDAHRNLNEIKAELELLNALYKGGAKVARPLADLSGSFIQSFNAAEGIRYGVLFAYAHGSVHQDLSAQDLETVGKEMALIHSISSSVELSWPRKSYGLDTMILDPIKRIKPDFKDMDEEYRYLVQTCARVMKKIEALDLSKFNYGYCHYDFLPKNFHFKDDGSITFFDFDFAGKGHLVNDLASFYAHFFLQVLSNKMTQKEADEDFGVFIAAYRSVRPLSDEELSAIPYFGFAWWIFYFGFHHDNFEDWSNFFYHPRFIKERVSWIKKWADWYIFK